MTFRVVRFATQETFATFAEHPQAIAAARDLARLHGEAFSVHAALQYDTELLVLAKGRPRRIKP